VGTVTNLHRTPSGEIDFEKLDSLPFGVILVDAEGKILFYNKQEERRAGRRRRSVLGKNFFTEVAPCAQVREFYEQYKRVVGDTGVIASFRFHFTLPGRPRDVQILMASFRHKGELLCLIIAGDLSP
jgi:photoactive yellow protein